MVTAYTERVAIIVDAAFTSNVRRLTWALGYSTGPAQGFSAELSVNGEQPPTAYGLSTAAQPNFVAMLSIDSAAQLPPVNWSTFGLSQAQVLAIIAHLQGPPQRYRVGPADSTDSTSQFLSLAADLGLDFARVPYDPDAR